MEELIKFIGMVPEYILHLEAILLALIAFFMIIPGDQPEKTLQKIVDLIKKLSLKKK